MKKRYWVPRAGGVRARRARGRSRILSSGDRSRTGQVYAPAFTWTGFYVEAQVGHAGADTEFSHTVQAVSASTRTAGSAAASSASTGRRTASSSGSRAA